VKFAPSGDLFASVGADAAVFLYDGKTGDVVAELKDAHQGSAVSSLLPNIMRRLHHSNALSRWHCVGVLTVKVSLLPQRIARSNYVRAMQTLSTEVWAFSRQSNTLGDVETRNVLNTWTLGSGVEHQQVGNTWAGDEDIVSLSVGGDLNIFDRRSGDRPRKILYVRMHMLYMSALRV
jgi:WD40 repeat protein